MSEWEPISRTALVDRIDQGARAMSETARRLWNAIRVEPVKWQLHPEGDPGGGFWVVALIGRNVIWYNDLEEGFNRSLYSEYGTIDDYWRNDDDLNVTVEYLVNALSSGHDLTVMGARMNRPKAKR